MLAALARVAFSNPQRLNHPGPQSRAHPSCPGGESKKNSPPGQEGGQPFRLTGWLMISRRIQDKTKSCSPPSPALHFRIPNASTTPARKAGPPLLSRRGIQEKLPSWTGGVAAASADGVVEGPRSLQHEALSFSLPCPRCICESPASRPPRPAKPGHPSCPGGESKKLPS